MDRECRVAFKEWAVTADALARGEQVLLLRKGGIHERDRHFKIEHDRFLLFPGYLHQDPELLKPAYRDRLTDEIPPKDPSRVTFSVYAQVADAIELDSEDAAVALEPFHIWAPGFALKRVHWKPLHPLNAILLRCFTLERPVTVPVTPEYAGCTSWVDLDRPIPLGGLTPALSDDEFARRVTELRAALAPAQARS